MDIEVWDVWGRSVKLDQAKCVDMGFPFNLEA